jgi:hypothetical protein
MVPLLFRLEAIAYFTHDDVSGCGHNHGYRLDQPIEQLRCMESHNCRLMERTEMVAGYGHHG